MKTNRENPALYAVAKKVCFEFDMPWTDPRTGVTHHPPKKRKKKRVRR